MDATNMQLTTTGGCTDNATITIGDYYVYPSGGVVWPWNTGVTYWPNYVVTEPTYCMGKAHVFECEHVSECKCGAIKRVMPRQKKAKKG